MLKKLFDFVYVKQSQLAAIFLSLVSLLIYLQNDHPSVYALQGVVAKFLTPLKYPILFLEDISNTKKQNRIMSERLIHLSVEAAKYSSLQKENQRLKRLIGFRESSPFQLIPAQILSRNISQELNSILIDIGKNQGVELYDPVVSVDGVVGKVFVVYDNTAIVELLTGPQFRISVMIKPAEATGILQWIGGNQFIITDIPNTLLIEPDNLVVTSGYSDIFPMNLPVGVVSHTEKAYDGFTIRVFGNLLVNFNQIHELFVLKAKHD